MLNFTEEEMSYSSEMNYPSQNVIFERKNGSSCNSLYDWLNDQKQARCMTLILVSRDNTVIKIIK